MEIRGGGKRDSRPLLLKLGFALALSIASYFASQFRSQPKRLPPPKSSSVDDGSKESTAKSGAMAVRGLKDELHVLTTEEALAKIINGTSSITTDETYLMPEFNKVVMNELEHTSVDKELGFEEREEMEKEVAYLRNLVEALKERERSLEIQMIEYHGLKEQVASLRELENRLKVSAMESKLLNFKVESLQADNQKLKAQVSGYPKVVAELESAREEVRLLKKRLNFDGEQAREKLAALHHRITELLERERTLPEDDVEVEKKVKRLKELEDEVMELRKANSMLAQENLKFAELLESAKMASSSDSDQREVRAVEEASSLREENDELKKEIEQLQTDRCADVEELVYLRWVNACLRYELRNYQPPPGKTVARDLSRCLSPESEKRAKQLILEYASSCCPDDKNISHFDFDTESCSSSQTSSEEHSDNSLAASSSTKNSSSRKSKLVTKLKRLVLGKDRNISKSDFMDGTTPASCGSSIRRASVSPCTYEHLNGRRNSFESISSCISMDNVPASHAQSQRHPRSSLDVEGSIAGRCRSDLGTSRGHMRMISEDCLSGLSRDIEHEDGDTPEKTRLKKFADALRGSHGPLKAKRRQASFSS